MPRLCISHFSGEMRPGLIQHNVSADVGRDVQVFAVADGGFAFFEATSGNDFQGQLFLEF